MLKAVVVDDEELTREGLIEFVDWTSLGYEIVGQASDGYEGLKLIEKVRPHLAICDIRMPKMNGIEMATAIKKLLPSCRIIILSGYSDKEYLKSAIKLNVSDYLEKPINLGELRQLLEKLRLDIQQEQDSIQHHSNLVEKIEMGNQYLLNNLIELLIFEKNYNEEKIHHLATHLNCEFILEAEYRVVTLKSKYPENILNIVEKINMLKNLYQLTMLIGQKKNVIVIIHTDQNLEEDIIDFYNLVLTELENEIQLEVEVGVGNKVYQLNAISQSYWASMDAIEWQGYKHKNRVVSNKGNRAKSIIRDIEKFIGENYGRDITVYEVAANVYLTPQYLCKLFKQETGQTINSYLTQLRMEKAVKLLENRNLKLYEVANLLGYEDSNYFSRVFKKHYGINPSEYRRNKHV